MNENIYEAKPELPQTKKPKLQLLKEFCVRYKIFIFSFLFVLFAIFVFFILYLENQKKREILLSEKYIQSKIYLEANNKDSAKNTLKEIIYENNLTYSTLSFFLILNQDLIKDKQELRLLFEHLLKENNFSKEEKNLLIYKKAIFDANFVNEAELLDSLKSLLNSDSMWKPHCLILLGDYFVSKNENNKAKEFYQKVFTINNLPNDLYEHVSLQLSIIAND
jgi:predicted negative regulator of RcsB-dependent stress response